MSSVFQLVALLQAFFFSLTFQQGKTVITVLCHAKRDEND
jgi:hypothetical protein